MTNELKISIKLNHRVIITSDDPIEALLWDERKHDGYVESLTLFLNKKNHLQTSLIDVVLPGVQELDGFDIVRKKGVGISYKLNKPLEKGEEYGFEFTEFTTPKMDFGDVSDGHHTFNELYDHRIGLFLRLMELDFAWAENMFPQDGSTWKSKINSDGSMWDGWFVAGMKINGKEISYHIPNKYWEKCPGKILEKGIWDGHTSNDVAERLLKDFE